MVRQKGKYRELERRNRRRAEKKGQQVEEDKKKVKNNGEKKLTDENYHVSEKYFLDFFRCVTYPYSVLISYSVLVYYM